MIQHPLSRSVRSVLSLAAVTVTVSALAIEARAQGTGGAPCATPLPDAITTVQVEGGAAHPNATRDGCWMFVAVATRGSTGAERGVAVLRRAGINFAEVRFVPTVVTPQALGGMVLTPDERTLITSFGPQVTFFDVERLKSGAGDPQLGLLKGARFRGSMGVSVTPDSRFAFAVQRDTSWVAVIDLEKGRSSGFESAVMGGVPTPYMPLTPILSPDGRYLLVSNTNAPEVLATTPQCEGGKTSEGGIQIADVQRAATEPASATVGWIFPAGCGVNGVTFSPDGARLSATIAGNIFDAAEKDNAVVIFDARPIREGKPAVRIGRVPVPKGPIGIVDRGDRMYVTFFPVAGKAAHILVLDPSKAADGEDAILGTLQAPSGHLALSPNGKTLLSGGFGGLNIIDLDRAPVQPAQK